MLSGWQGPLNDCVRQLLQDGMRGREKVDTDQSMAMQPVLLLLCRRRFRFINPQSSSRCIPFFALHPPTRMLKGYHHHVQMFET